MPRRLAAVVLTIVMLGVCGSAVAEPTTLTHEDIVRLFVTGASEDDLIEQIETAQVDFDLSEEMLEELKIAGIPAALIRAMIRRQAEMTPTPDIAEAAAATDAPRLLVQLNTDRQTEGAGSLPTIQSLSDIDPKLSERLGLRRSDLPITDLGIALFCRTADHVPDHWRGKSPLGRDFANAARHKMLVYLSGAEAKPAGKFRNMLTKLGKVPGEHDALAKLQVLTLEVPERLVVELEPGVAHDLTLGIAVQIGNRNYLALADHRDGVVVEQETTLRAILRGGNKNPLKARVAFADDSSKEGS